MASTHKHIRSSTANKRPTTAIADGQIALNTNSTSPGLFFKDSTGATIIKIGPVHVGTTAPNVSPAAGGSSGNSTGEVWLDTSLTPVGVKIWNGSTWTNATPIGSTTVQGLLELATSAETQAGTDTDRAVTPAGLQSKVSDSTSTTSSTTIASSTAVKAAYDLANAALPKSGGTVTGNLEIGSAGSLTFEGSTADAFETTLAVADPTADRIITLPDTTGTVITTGDTGTVTGTMIASGTVTSTNIADGTIVDADISATAEIAVGKLADGAARQLLQTDAAGTGVEWTNNVDIPGTLDVTSAATFDSTIGASAGAAATPSITFTGDLNTGLWSPGADTIAASTAGSERFRIDSSGRVGIGTASPSTTLHAVGDFSLSNTAGNNAFIEIAANARTLGSKSMLLGQLSAGDAYCWNRENATLLFGTNNTERARIDSSGRLGIGTTSPGTTLDVNGGCQITGSASGYSGGEVRLGATTADLQHSISTQSTGTPFMFFDHRGTSNTGIFAWRVGTGGASERMRIDSSGRLLVGTSSAGGNGRIVVAGNPVYPTGSNSFGILRLATNNTTPANNEDLGYLEFHNATGAGSGPTISAARDGGTWTSGSSHPSRLVFSTTADGASSPTERMRILQSGDVQLLGAGNVFSVESSGAPGTTVRTIFSGHSSTGFGSRVISFQVWNNGNVQNTNNSYGAISDVKLKENIVDATSQWDDLKALQVRKYNFKEETGQETHTQIGLIAQEVELVSPGLVTESPDRDAEGNDLGTVTKSVNYSVLYMKAVKALQEAMERIETLEAKVAALENA